MGISLLLPTLCSTVSLFPTAPWHTRRLYNCLFRRNLMPTEAITWIFDRIWRIRLPDQQTRQVYHLTRWVMQTYCHKARKGLIISLRTENKRPRQHRYFVTRGLIWCSIGWCWCWVATNERRHCVYNVFAYWLRTHGAIVRTRTQDDIIFYADIAWPTPMLFNKAEYCVSSLLPRWQTALILYGPWLLQ